MKLAIVSIQELWPILLLVFILFGGRRIPELFRGLGEGMKEFKKATRDLSEEESTPPAPRRDDASGTSDTRDGTTRSGAGH